MRQKEVKVIIYRTRHKSQPYRVDINGIGSGPIQTLQERYVRPWTAKRGALRHLKASGNTSRITFEYVGK